MQRTDDDHISAREDEIVHELGYDNTLKREFKLWSAVALPFAIISPIVAIYTIFGLGISAGGPAFWWTFPIVLVGQLLVALIFAELASGWPLAGGVYQWSRHLMGASYGWFAGWVYIMTLTVGSTAVAYTGATFLAPVLDIDEPSNGTLVLFALGIIVLCLIANTLSRTLLKLVMGVAIAAEVIGSLVIGTVLLVGYRENSISVLFDSFGTADGGSYFTGPLLAAGAFTAWAFVGFESAGSIAEEVRAPRRDVPRAILISLVVVGSIAMYSAIALILSIPDLAAVVSGKDADPIATTITTHLGDGVLKPLFLLVVVAMTATVAATQAAVSRLIFACSRDDSLPAAKLLGRVSGENRLPVVAILVAGIGSALLLALTGSDIYATLISLTTGGFYLSFAFPTVAALACRISGRWRSGEFTLGRYGLLINVIALLWLFFALVNIAWPRASELPWYQNWGVVVMIVAVLILGLVLWSSLRGRIEASGHGPAVGTEDNPESAVAQPAGGASGPRG